MCWLDSAWTDGLPIKTSCAARSMLGRINAPINTKGGRGGGGFRPRFHVQRGGPGWIGDQAKVTLPMDCFLPHFLPHARLAGITIVEKRVQEGFEE